ncbi:hypothetical protein FACS189464_0670 [Bacteroidia bacterium]|nr:hypothetical protein FACS189430_01510 [Bacteroidia bacterium]GHT77984.1 hypothetical protein FACS189464_0670 [Bacteroidia bacterium]
MKFVFSKHAAEQMFRRGISQEQALSVLLQPEEILTENGVDIFQSIIEESGQKFLLRVFVNTNQFPKVVVTLYKTTKINKYYEGKI